MKSVVNACNDIVREDIAPNVDKRLTEFKGKEEANKIFKKKSDAKAVEALEKEYAIAGTDEAWHKELQNGITASIKGVTVKTVRESKATKHKSKDSGNEVPNKKKKKSARKLD